MRDFNLSSPQDILDMATAFWFSKTILAANDLEVFSHLSGSPAPIERLAERLLLDMEPAQLLADACVSLGLLRKDGNRYSNSDLAEECLVKGKPNYLGDCLLGLNSFSFPYWAKLERAIRSNAPVSPMGQSKVSLDIFRKSRSSSSLVTKMMYQANIQVAQRFANTIDLSNYTMLLCIGGATAVFAITLLQRYPHLKALVCDRPYGLEAIDPYIIQHHLNDKVHTIPIEIGLDDLPEGFDVAILGHYTSILDEETNRILVDQVYKSLPSGGIYFIIDYMMNDEQNSPVLSILELEALIHGAMGNITRVNEIFTWIKTAGFKTVNMTQIDRLNCVVFGSK